MCGIFGFVTKKETSVSTVLEGLKSLEYRGYDSWGVAYLQTANKNIPVIKHTGKIGGTALDGNLTTTLAIGHTRWATHGGVTDANAHPHLDCTGTIAVVHNGIITNFESLKNMLLSHDHTFASETDSEIAAHLIEEKIKTISFTEAVQETFLSLTGMNALVVMDTKSHTLIAIKNGSPLIVGTGKDGTYVASDPYTLSPYAESIHVLTNGQMAILSDGNISIQDIETGKNLPFEGKTPPKSADDGNLNGFKSLMEKEMNEQPAMLLRIAQTDTESEKTVSKIQDILDKSQRIILIGCGSAYFAGLAGAYMFAGLKKRGAIAISASELANQIPDVDKETTIIALSQSGETADTLHAVLWAKKMGAKIIGLINVPHSAIWRACDVALALDARQEKAVASTKAFTAKLAWLYRIISPESDNLSIKRAGDTVRNLLSESTHKRIIEIAEKIQNSEHILVVGHGYNVPIAFEIAMKIKEITYIHAEGMTSTELKHGPIALVEKGTPCIVLTSGENDVIAGNAASELKARGAFVIGVGLTKQQAFDEYIGIPVDGIPSIIPAAVVGQILAFVVADMRGLDSDKPRNLAKSVTV
jgi:glucosamine--fructose-6-phosphate aminotransferase (isomerizing)